MEWILCSESLPEDPYKDYLIRMYDGTVKAVSLVGQPGDYYWMDDDRYYEAEEPQAWAENLSRVNLWKNEEEGEKIMEHVITLAIDIDDTDIKNRVNEIAAKKIGEDTIKALGVKDRWGYDEDPEDVIKKLVNQRVDEFIASHNDEIIAEASKQLADKLSRTKRVKEATMKVLQETGLEE